MSNSDIENAAYSIALNYEESEQSIILSSISGNIKNLIISRVNSIKRKLDAGYGNGVSI